MQIHTDTHCMQLITHFMQNTHTHTVKLPSIVPYNQSYYNRGTQH